MRSLRDFQYRTAIATQAGKQSTESSGMKWAFQSNGNTGVADNCNSSLQEAIAINEFHNSVTSS